MFRLAQNDLADWYDSKNRKPLILRGARQVGKSTLVRQFCHDKKLVLFEINLEEQPLKSLNKEGFKLEEIIKEIEFICKNKILSNECLIFLDEIQNQPKAINLLRYFYEKRRELAIVAAGSLLEVVLKQEEIEFPVGRVGFYQLGPMTFYEFLLGIEEKELAEFIRTPAPPPQFIHEVLNEKLKEFFIVGGMPESISCFHQTKSMDEVAKVQNQLLETYRNDFYKYAKQGKIPKLNHVFDYVPTHLGKKVKYVEISRDHKSKDLQEAIEILTDSRIINPVSFTKGSKLPLKSESDLSLFKLYFLDVGLCAKVNNLSLNTFEDDEFSFYFKGELAEQFIFQHLYYGHGKFENPNLYYWKNEKKNAEAEIDFLMEFQQKDKNLNRKTLSLPIEVKSGSSQKLKSLFYFMNLRNKKLAIKFSPMHFQTEKIQTKIFDGDQLKIVEFTLLNIPLYFVDQLNQILDL
jgi:predicted AAA+ superfamily ATPase